MRIAMSSQFVFTFPLIYNYFTTLSDKLFYADKPNSIFLWLGMRSSFSFGIIDM